MKQVITTEKTPIKLWLGEIDEVALKQAQHIANLPFTFRHVAIMPDCHPGYGMPIGGVLATNGVIIPNAVGVDIGCGMCAIKTSLTEIDKTTLLKILEGIREKIPVGFNRHEKSQDESLLPSKEGIVKGGIIERQFIAAQKQIGTLGGGNHFIEIQEGSDGHIWIMIHSGSRNIGLKVAEYYNKLAINLNKRWYSQVDPDWQLAFLPIETKEANNYWAEMQYCVDFAFANRKLMMENIKLVFMEEFKDQFNELDFINIAHNYAAWENHYKTNVIVHRKGATRAREGELGIIPGSQGTKSFIVKGMGNMDSFTSCSHGAGRKMGRKQAQKNLSLENEIKLLDSRGVIHAIQSEKDLDEAPGAYKDINRVMENQKDLVEIVVELSPLAVIKG